MIIRASFNREITKNVDKDALTNMASVYFLPYGILPPPKKEERPKITVEVQNFFGGCFSLFRYCLREALSRDKDEAKKHRKRFVVKIVPVNETPISINLK